MSWVRFETQMPMHRKVMALDDRALALWVTGMCWSGEHLTDGHLTPSDIVAIGRLRNLAGKALDGAAQSLVEAGMWHQVDGGVEIHDYLAYQPSGASERARKEADRDRQARRRAKGAKTVEQDARGRFVRPESRRDTTRDTPRESRHVSPANPNPNPNPKGKDHYSPTSVSHEPGGLGWVPVLASHLQELLAERGTKASPAKCTEVIATLAEHLEQHAVHDLVEGVLTADQQPKSPQWLLGVATHRWPGWDQPPDVIVHPPITDMGTDKPDPATVAAGVAKARAALTAKEAS